MGGSWGHSFTMSLRKEAVAEKAIISFLFQCLLKWQAHKVLFVKCITVFWDGKDRALSGAVCSRTVPTVCKDWALNFCEHAAFCLPVGSEQAHWALAGVYVDYLDYYQPQMIKSWSCGGQRAAARSSVRRDGWAVWRDHQSPAELCPPLRGCFPCLTRL